MTGLRLTLVVVFAAVIESVVLAEWRVGGVAPQALLLVGIATGVVAGPHRGAMVGFAAGIVADLFTSTPFGLSALAFCVVGYTVGLLQSSILRAAWWIPVVVGSVASAAGVVVFAFAGAVVGVSHLVTPHLPVVALGVGIMNGLLAVPLVPVLRWAMTVEIDRVAIR